MWSGAAGVVILALVAGVLMVTGTGDSGSTHAAVRRNLQPFRQAVEGLAGARGLRYRDTSAFGITENGITVTAGGSKYGATSSGGGVDHRTDEDVLDVGGKTFLRWQKDPSPAPGAKPGNGPSEWMVGLDDGDSLIHEALSRTVPPHQLAGVLSKALDALEKTPAPAHQPAERPRSVQGEPALAADTSAGRLLVTRQAPHRVLRLEPYDLHDELTQRLKDGEAPTSIPEVTTGPLAAGGAEGMDLTPVVGAAVQAMFDTLLSYTKELKNAGDDGIDFTLDGLGDLKCGAGGCSVVQKFTGDVSAKARTERVTAGEVSAVLNATFSIGGRSAGKCTSQRGTFPLSGSAVSGTLTCSDPGAGSVYSSVAAQYKAQADARSRASGGATVRYTIPFRADTLVDARALATVEVDRLVDRVQKERDAADCATPHSFPPDTQVLLADGTHRAISGIRAGDRVTATDPGRGLTVARPVTRTITTDDDENFTRLTVSTSRGPAAVTATDNHPFWLTNTGHWTDAAAIRPGDALRSPGGAPFRVTAVSDQRGRERTYDLTVGGLHTYYVLAGGAPVLVHNSNDCVNWAVSSVKTWGHTFKTHGAGAKNTKSLTDRARSTGKQQGQWLDNGAAADFLKGIHVQGFGPRAVRIPDGLGQVIMPDGSIAQAGAATIVPSSNGLYKTAYPITGTS
ncbi:Hint domain-containing protein [Streptomyces sp. NBC_00388]|uniref:Hint domain-containing protein n=1 Tax=Streptomyces sp. NBC_00388 TaxID=2975735 RepID=UPI002E211BC0